MINNPIKSLEFDKEYTLTPQYVEPDLSLSEGKILLGEFDESHNNIMSIRTNDTLNYVDNTLFTPNLSVDNTVTVGTIKNSDKEYVISDDNNNMIFKVDSNGLETTKIRATEFEGDVNGTASSAATADKLTTSRNIKLTGSVTGNANFDGSGNIEISTTTNHNHDSAYLKLSGGTVNGDITCQGSIQADGSFIGSLAGTASNADTLKLFNGVGSGEKRLSICATTLAQSVGYGDMYQIPKIYLNDDSSIFTIDYETLINSAVEINDNISAGGTISATGGFIGDVTGNCSGSSGSCTGNAATATTATNATNVMINNTDTNDALPILFTTWNDGTASNRAVYMDSTKSFYYNPSTNTVTTTGTMTATNGFYETSDERLKEIIRPVRVDLEKLSKLRKVYFTWKDNPKFGSHKNIGMIAQDVKELYPELITEQNGQLSLSYDKLSVIALEAIDILYKENKELKEQLVKCENKCFDLEEKFIDLEALVKKLIKKMN